MLLWCEHTSVVLTCSGSILVRASCVPCNRECLIGGQRYRLRCTISAIAGGWPLRRHWRREPVKPAQARRPRESGMLIDSIVGRGRETPVKDRPSPRRNDWPMRAAPRAEPAARAHAGPMTASSALSWSRRRAAARSPSARSASTRMSPASAPNRCRFYSRATILLLAFAVPCPPVFSQPSSPTARGLQQAAS